MRKQLAISITIALVVLLFIGILTYKRPLNTITNGELDAINGIRVDLVDGNHGVISTRITDYIKQNPDCTVEDLRIIKGVDDMIIDQLRKEFR